MNEEKSSTGSRYVVYSFIIVAVLILILILFLYLIHSPLIFRSGASSLLLPSATSEPAEATLSLDNSYIFASPLRAKAGGEKIRITVYILDTRGLGISGKTVTVGGGNSLQVTPVQPSSDSQGMASFDVSAGSAGVYVIQASVDGRNLIQQVTISFD